MRSEYINVFKRHEIKYLLTNEQLEKFESIIGEYLEPDPHGGSKVLSVYYDTPNFRLIRRSLEKPPYKEKLRVRSYGTATDESIVFLELKKKYKGTVYKRRIELSDRDAEMYMSGKAPLPQKSQIGREIDYFRQFYGTLVPQVYIDCDRRAYFSKDDPNLRVTFDQNIEYRTDNVSLKNAPGGRKILPDGVTLLEIKAANAVPLWMVEAINECRLRKTSFSKYGTAYIQLLSESLEKAPRRAAAPATKYIPQTAKSARAGLRGLEYTNGSERI
ncbi:MAG: polyphosphate polymerase domain-containing protein [Eubacterium sp.]|jgi:hypothetical protein